MRGYYYDQTGEAPGAPRRRFSQGAAGGGAAQRRCSSFS